MQNQQKKKTVSDLIESLNRQHDRVRDPFAIKKESSIFSEAVNLIEQQQKRIVELEESVTVWKRTSEDLVKYRDELASTVERLRESLQKVLDDSNIGVVPKSHLNSIEHLLKSAPQQSLAERDAEVIIQAVNKCKLRVLDGPDIYSDALIEYANQLNRG